MEQIGEEKGMIFDLQRFSVHDGPGIRTLVFFKGCPLRCTWCCNPESQSLKKQLMVVEENCIGCRRCEQVCSYGAISFDNGLQVDRAKCVDCGSCSEVCFSEALTVVGKEMTVSELITELKKDEVHYRKSNGGITLSGGEALAQPKLAAALLKACKEQGWHTAMESTGYASKKVGSEMCIRDSKHVNSVKHQKFVGQPNALILEAAKIIAEYPETKLEVRVPVVPGFNDHPEEIAQITLIAKQLKVSKLYLLPYHPYGANKYRNLGQEYEAVQLEAPKKEQMKILKELVDGIGIACQIGG